VTRPETLLAGVKRHLPRILEQLESIRWQLIGVTHSLPEPPAELEDGADELDAATKLRNTIECVLADEVEPALADLRRALASLGDLEEGQ